MENKEDILKQYVCEMPFMYSDVQWSSQFVCCPSWAPQSIRVDESGKENWFPVNEQDDVMRNWTSDIAFNIRKSVTNGTYKYCDRNICPRLNELVNTQRKPYLFQDVLMFYILAIFGYLDLPRSLEIS